MFSSRQPADGPVFLVTGGCGFIGSALVRFLLAQTDATVVNVAKLTYAGNLEAVAAAAGNPRYHFERVDICDGGEIRRILQQYRPHYLVHLAAESHVDRSIDGPGDFIHTNVQGTYTLLEESRRYLDGLRAGETFRFHHVSTDEVFGSLGETGKFTETTRYDPSSPYSASKAASDHLVTAWHRTYGVPMVMTNCSNNYGPYQFPEKLIPLMIVNALRGKPLPIYGSGENIRDWLFVEDHVRALYLVATTATDGASYNIGGCNERSNLQVVYSLCDILEEMQPEHTPGVERYADLVTHQQDRPGHDRRYAIDATAIGRDLGWTPRETFDTGLRKTVAWYLANRGWWQRVMDGSYRGERLGLGASSAAAGESG